MTPQLSAALAELCKMGLQLGGALLIAWLAVQWALGRYKSEKMWERESAALLDLLASLQGIERALSEWLEEEYEGMQTTDDTVKEARRRTYEKAMSQLRAVAATASIVLPIRLSESVDRLIGDLEAEPDTDDWIHEYEKAIRAVKTVRVSVVQFGRQGRR